LASVSGNSRRLDGTKFAKFSLKISTGDLEEEIANIDGIGRFKVGKIISWRARYGLTAIITSTSVSSSLKGPVTILTFAWGSVTVTRDHLSSDLTGTFFSKGRLSGLLDGRLFIISSWSNIIAVFSESRWSNAGSLELRPEEE
jgi:hypothetical protein